jgi:hypothetical protein
VRRGEERGGKVVGREGEGGEEGKGWDERGNEGRGGKS